MIKSDVYREVINEYKNKKMINEGTSQQRKEKLYILRPELKDIHTELSILGCSIAKDIISAKNPEELIINLEKEQKELLEKEKSILLDENYPVDYFDNTYSCEKCQDSGFIDNEECICFKQRIVEKYYAMSNIKKILKEENFDNFNISFFSREIIPDKGISPFDNMRHAYNVSMEFVNNFNSKFENLFFYGPTGRGKTFLCNCIAKDILDKGHTVVYLTAADFFRTFENYRFHREDMNRPEYYINLILDSELLILDDLGTEIPSVVTSSELFNVINSRLQKEKHTIISTNLALADLKNYYSHRLESRIVGNYSLLEIFGEDIRIVKKY